MEHPLIAPVLEAARQIALTLSPETSTAICFFYPSASRSPPLGLTLNKQKVIWPQVTVLDISLVWICFMEHSMLSCSMVIHKDTISLLPQSIPS